MANLKLTKKVIDAFEYEGDGQSIDYRWDTEMRGFGVRVYPSGRKSFVLLYRHNGKQRQFTLGRYGQITLEEARDLAKKRFGQVADNHDILEERQEARKKNDMTVKKAFAQFLKRYAEIHNRNWQESKRIFEYDVLPKIGNKAIDEVTKADIIKIIDAVMDRGKHTQANRTFAAVRKFFNWCVERDILKTSPVMGLKAPAKSKSRERVLLDNELREVWLAAENIGYPFGSIVQCLILTGQRKSEVTTMRWEDIDLKKRLWTIPREMNKSARTHNVHLSNAVIDIITAAPKLGDFVFTSSGAKPYENFSRGYNALIATVTAKRKAEGFRAAPHWTLHDLRRTLSSGMAALEIQPYVADKILNHKSGVISGVMAVYNRYDYAKEAKAALILWAAHVQEIVANPKTSGSHLSV